jgi:hypothetical protein
LMLINSTYPKKPLKLSKSEPPYFYGGTNILSGAERDRTADLMLAKHALSQLSYCPVDASGPKWT